MRLGYNTNGFAFHRPEQALAVLAEIGYHSVALTVDHDCLDPYGPHFEEQLRRIQALLDRYSLASVVETGARYLLDPWEKHEPTLVSAGESARARRIDFLTRCIEIAERLGSDAVSLWSGRVRDDADPEEVWRRLCQGCLRVLEEADRRGVRLAFEPEPGMFIERMDQFDELCERLDQPPLWGLTLDVGHVHCLDDGSIPQRIRQFAHRLLNVHIEDMRRGVHEHLPFGAGEIDFPPVIAALVDVGFTGGVHVELSRHSHMAPELAQESHLFLHRLLEQAESDRQGTPSSPPENPAV